MLRPIEIKEAIALAANRRIVLSEIEPEVKLKDVVSDSDNLTLGFGPEGGWTEKELQLFHQAGWISASLGGTILRAETAAIAGLAVAVAEMNG
jgi:16S rRNA (uracil1498-N3)-methyltransferase